MDRLQLAKDLFRQYTQNTGRIDYLYGPSKIDERADILSALAGERIPRKLAAWGRFCSCMYLLWEVEGNCIAARDSALRIAVTGEGIET